MEQDYDIHLFVSMPDGRTTGYAPAMVRPGGWDLWGILKFLNDDIWTLARTEIWAGGSALVQIRRHGDPRILVAYEVTGGYLRGFVWRRL